MDGLYGEQVRCGLQIHRLWRAGQVADCSAKLIWQLAVIIGSSW